MSAKVYSPGTMHGPTDAGLILELIHATRRWSDVRERAAVAKPLRELLWFVWEQPRLRELALANGQHLVRSKYPSWVPWSPAARAAYGAEGSRARLIIEHVTPTRIVVGDLLERPPANPAALIRVLNRRLQYTVLTPGDNRLLTKAGVGHKLVSGSTDPWDRYRVAGLDPDSFRPLGETPIVRSSPTTRPAEH